MVHVLQRLDHEAWTEATGDELTDDDSGFGYVILLDYWILIAAMMIGAALGYGLVL